MRPVCVPLFFFCLLSLNGQTPASTPAAPSGQLEQPSEQQLSPQAAYDQATRPLDIIRRSPQNWSEVELAALKAARAQAGIACTARNPEQLSGTDLLALAHLCAFAQLWQPVLQAATGYLAAAQAGPQPDSVPGSTPPTLLNDAKALTALATAFDYKVQASLNLDKPDDALATAQTMLRTVPYDEFSSEATNSTQRYLHFIHPDQALALLMQRQPLVVDLIKTQSPSATPASMSEQDSHSRLPLYLLYSDALALPSMQQFVNQPEAAAASYAALEAALPASLSSEDGMFIAEKRRQYLLLGTHLPALTAMGSLASPNAAAPGNLNTFFAHASIFLLFPDWCNQCVALAFNSPPRAKELLDGFHVRFFPLIAQDGPPEKRTENALKNVPLPPQKPASADSASPGKLHVDQQIAVTSTPDARLAGTPTLVVPNETLAEFAATDFPLIIAVDDQGIIRGMQVAVDDALAPGGDVDQMAQHILATWPPK